MSKMLQISLKVYEMYVIQLVNKRSKINQESIRTYHISPDSWGFDNEDVTQ